MCTTSALHITCYEHRLWIMGNRNTMCVCVWCCVVTPTWQTNCLMRKSQYIGALRTHTHTHPYTLPFPEARILLYDYTVNDPIPSVTLFSVSTSDLPGSIVSNSSTYINTNRSVRVYIVHIEIHTCICRSILTWSPA